MRSGTAVRIFTNSSKPLLTNLRVSSQFRRRIIIFDATTPHLRNGS
jgi:hypothetical protein